MKLPADATIASTKVSQYLLAHRKRNDKSAWLAQAGYTVENWQILEKDLRTQILPLEATLTDNSPYGQIYEIEGKLTGPNGKTLPVYTIWMVEKVTGETKFITLFPNKGRRR
jgi:hypothetical protein